MPRPKRSGHPRISESNHIPSHEIADNQYVTLDAFNTMIQEIQSLKSLIQNQTTNVETMTSEDARSSTIVSDHSNSNGMVKSIYDNIPQYNGDGDIQKLLDFIDKVDDYLVIANTTPMMEIMLITTKLTSTASLLWRHHKHMHNTESPHRITTWRGLKHLLMQNKVTKEQERYVLSQLDLLTQKESVQRYNTEFERYTMQLIDLPLTIEMHYYLKGLKVEIRQLVESNELNLTDMTTLKNACIRQGHIMSLPPGSDRKTSKSNEENVALTVSTQGKHSYRSRGRDARKGKFNRRNSYNSDKRDEYTLTKIDSNESKEHIQRNSRYMDKGALQKENDTYIRCYVCSKNGHIARECPAVKETIDRCRKDKNKTANTSSIRTMFASTNARDHSKLRFLIDSGTTQHMTPHREILQDIVATSKQISTACNHVTDAVGEGNTIVMDELQLTNVLLAPELQESLLSVAAVNDHGYDVTFKHNGEVVIADGNETIAEGYREGNLYYLQLQSMSSVEEDDISIAANIPSDFESSCVFRTNVEPMSDYQIWHLRLGHLSASSLLKMPQIVQGMSKINLTPPTSHICEGCIYGKQCRKPFAESTTQRELMELVHSDIMGPIKVPSLNKSRYVLTFIEHRSRYPKCYFTTNKDAQTVLKHFKEYKVWAENITERKIKILRTDGGREYINTVLDEYLKENGIEHQHTVPYTPQQNGVAERFNRTVIERTRAILHSQGLPSKLWAEVLDTVRYLYTLGPIRAITNGNPQMIFRNTEQKPNVDHLRILGCAAYVHINKQLRTKLDAKSTKCILIGYGDDCKAYRVWDPVTNRVYHSRDIIFDETQIGIKDENVQDIILLEEGISDIFELNDDREYDIEQIVQERMKNDEKEYYVKWRGYDKSENTWEPYYHLEHTQALDEWEKQLTVYTTVTVENTSYLQTDPQNLQEAMNRSDCKRWTEAMTNEIKSLQENDTWELVKRPTNRDVIDTRWVFHIKKRIDGSIEKRKARFVARGFTQIPGIDFNETYAPVVSHTAIRMLIALATRYKLIIHQMDVKSAFLHGDIDTELYVEQPKMFEQGERRTWVCRLKKGLYGLKQAGRIWNKTLHNHLIAHGYTSLESEPSIYIKRNNNNDIVIIAVYVDDLQIASNDINVLHQAKLSLSTQFKMTDLGEVHHILGLRVLRDDKSTSIDQTHYIEGVLKKYNMYECIPINTPMESNLQLTPLPLDEEEHNVHQYRSIIGALNYAAVLTRPDIATAVGLLVRHMQRPGKIHWNALLRILRYLKGTIHYSLVYHIQSHKDNEMDLQVYCDSDWAGERSDRKSTTGYVIMMNGAAMSWKSTKQSTVALSTVEAEFIALATMITEVIWMRRILCEVGYNLSNATVINVDNTGAINITNNGIISQRTKHIDIRYHFLHENIEANIIHLQHCNSKDNTADTLMKALPYPRFKECRAEMGVREII